VRTQPKSNLIQIHSSYFTAGLEWNDDVVTLAAPIIKYMKGWPAMKVIDYCARKGWKVVEVQ
jgi:hypothetical protein